MNAKCEGEHNATPQQSMPMDSGPGGRGGLKIECLAHQWNLSQQIHSINLTDIKDPNFVVNLICSVV